LWEAPVFAERTSVGLDVHARSVAAAAIDGVTGELFQASNAKRIRGASELVRRRWADLSLSELAHEAHTELVNVVVE
jgi:hypothetical protein